MKLNVQFSTSTSHRKKHHPKNLKKYLIFQPTNLSFQLRYDALVLVGGRSKRGFRKCMKRRSRNKTKRLVVTVDFRVGGFSNFFHLAYVERHIQNIATNLENFYQLAQS